MKKSVKLLYLIVSLIFLQLSLHASLELDVETGALFSGYNDIRIPGDEGTLFSLSEELETDVIPFYRLRAFYSFNSRHHLGVLLAPLSVKSEGKLDRDLNFQDKFGLLLDGDALAAPQGRAEDVLAAITYDISDQLRLKAGYRILEGGADNDEVYTFALFHYAVLGLIIDF
ncbi:MAG: hypothetical protein APR54_08965 [Candidatus Cloacimonas sp. SDB]|nr:MAG: hypothetical protein APR54_08965 [Candidatus Cloacimonas sp. SDB]